MIPYSLMTSIPKITPANPWRLLQNELRDLAFVLDRQGDHGGADVASITAARIGELLDEVATAPAPSAASLAFGKSE